MDRQNRGSWIRGAGLNILVTGRGGKSGAWEIRGNQLGKAIGADVIPNALDVGAYDLAIMVKRPRLDIVERCRRAGVPLVWDVVDAYPQPEANTWNRDACLAWLGAHLDQIRPAGVVAATYAMAVDLQSLTNAPVLYLPHHARLGMAVNEIRERVHVVGYEGGLQHLGRWHGVLESECRRRGWKFVTNPPVLAELDIVVALREADGYAPRHWKSGVKAANAQATGTPFIGSPEAGYLEMSCGCERFVETESDLRHAFDILTPYAERKRVSGWMKALAPSLDQVAEKYRSWLRTIRA